MQSKNVQKQYFLGSKPMIILVLIIILLSVIVWQLTMSASHQPHQADETIQKPSLPLGNKVHEPHLTAQIKHSKSVEQMSVLSEPDVEVEIEPEIIPATEKDIPITNKFPAQYIPPINNQAKSPVSYQGDLNDFDAYQNYENQQDEQLKSAFINASKAKVSELKKWLARGEKAKLSPEQLAFAKEKIAALEALSTTLTNELNLQSAGQNP